MHACLFFSYYSGTAPTYCSSMRVSPGEEGKVDEAQKLMEEADVLRKVRGAAGWVST